MACALFSDPSPVLGFHLLIDQRKNFSDRPKTFLAAGTLCNGGTETHFWLEKAQKVFTACQGICCSISLRCC